jgi:ATP-dependent DNA helicase RecG
MEQDGRGKHVTAEYQHIEYKQSLGEKHEATIALAAFATAQGGEVRFGIAPNGRRIGVQIGRTTLEELANYIRQNTDPPLFPDIAVEGDEASAVVVVRIEENPVKPVWAFGKPYKRVGRTNQSLSREETLRMTDVTRGFTWDALPCPGLTFDDLSRAEIERYLRRAGLDIATPTETVLHNLSLSAGTTLFNGAALLFTANPGRWIVGARVQCARFIGTQSVEFLSEQSFEGAALTQIEEAEKFVTRNTRQSIVITGRPQHERVPEYPAAAVREAIVNAVCHRDYTEAGTVQVRIYDDRLEVWNPGSLPYDLSVEDLYHPHRSRPRNKRLAEAFFRAGLIEAWGTGTLRIIAPYAEQGLPLPEFHHQTHTFIARLFPTPPPFTSSTAAQTTDLSQLNERQRRAVEYVRQHGSITVPKYLSLADISDRQARTDLRQLIERGVLMAQGKGRATRYVFVS